MANVSEDNDENCAIIRINKYSSILFKLRKLLLKQRSIQCYEEQKINYHKIENQISGFNEMGNH